MRPLSLRWLGALGVVLVAGCAGQSAPPVAGSSSPQKTFSVDAAFAESGPAVTYNPALVPAGAKAGVEGSTGNGETDVTLTVSGLLPNRQYGAHAHAMPCGPAGDNAGPHFQHVKDPQTPSVDPAYANSRNEIWLDLTTDAQGSAVSRAAVDWDLSPDRRPASVIIHEMVTSTEAGKAGTAGPRLACVSVGF